MTDQTTSEQRALVAAREAASIYAKEAGWGEGSVYAISGQADMQEDESRLVQALYRAIMTAKMRERERCAKIVLERTPVGPYAKHYVHVLVHEIAAAIRQQRDQ